MSTLKDLDIVHLTDKYQYALSRNFSEMKLAELYHLLPWRFPADECLANAPKKIKALFLKVNKSLDQALQVSLAETYNL